jgi:hypothetical protein
MTSVTIASGNLKRPDFIIIGAQKCGTSTLFRNLGKHPDISLPRRKELHFFDENFSQGLEWYLRFFNKQGHGMPQCTGEASPYYFFHPLAPERIFRTFPAIRLILLLRNPVNRSYSQYHHMKRKGRVSLLFEHCIRLEEHILENRKNPFYKEENHSDLMYRRFSFLARSRYAEQLSRWLTLFPHEQLLIVRSEDYFAEPERILAEVFRFLEMPSVKITIAKNHEGSSYPPLKPETRVWLENYFRPFNQQLYDLTGRNFGWDSHPDTGKNSND